MPKCTSYRYKYNPRRRDHIVLGEALGGGVRGGGSRGGYEGRIGHHHQWRGAGSGINGTRGERSRADDSGKKRREPSTPHSDRACDDAVGVGTGRAALRAWSKLMRTLC